MFAGSDVDVINSPLSLDRSCKQLGDGDDDAAAAVEVVVAVVDDDVERDDDDVDSRDRRTRGVVEQQRQRLRRPSGINDDVPRGDDDGDDAGLSSTL